VKRNTLCNEKNENPINRKRREDTGRRWKPTRHVMKNTKKNKIIMK
jgi:hypothetical protein